MLNPIAHDLDTLADWRAACVRQLVALGRWLSDHDLLDDADAAALTALRERLAGDQLVLAFVAEFSRGKSELINAIFFADVGQRVLPATPGRTTMCPVELRHDPDVPPRLALLPIETRLRGLSLAELRPRESHWHLVPLDPARPASLVQALTAVTRVQRVSVEQASALGFWDPAQPDDNPPQWPDGSVEVPAWRHAVIHYPHPLLQRGLVVIDTPGLNAIGAEPELTLGLLPTAHAVVFVLGADTGVTRSDLAVWRNHLDAAQIERFVVLNKIDTLSDPLLSDEQVREQIEQQRALTAATLRVSLPRVFAVSARDGLAARVGADASGLDASGLPRLEAALAQELLPRRRALLLQSLLNALARLRASVARRVADRRRQHAEALLELRGLRGKSGTKWRLLAERVQAESTDFERCTARLTALRAVQARSLQALLEPLSSDALRTEVAVMQAASGALTLVLGGRAVFGQLLTRLRATLEAATLAADELRQMLEGSFRGLNTEFGLTLVLEPPPSLLPFTQELGDIERAYGRYLGAGQVWRRARPGFAEQFRRMLLARLRVVFESAAGELDGWSKAAQGQLEAQVRERRHALARRRETLQRVKGATGELEQRIAEVHALDEQGAQLLLRLDAMLAQIEASVQAPEPGSVATQRDVA